MYPHEKIESERDLRFDELRAVNNIKALGESDADHWLRLFAGKAKDLAWAISASLAPSTGCKSDRRSTVILEALYSYEKAFLFRETVMKRIASAMRKNRDHAERFGVR